ncbi:MAG TPA: hypothetical protein EYN51_01810 [Flavobacteriales bacterium]|nr:hypothetical protein [Flavobacteriales bacterium]
MKILIPMIITCLSCSTKYSIKKRVLGKNGKKVKCYNCGHEWYQKLDIIKKSLQIEPSKEKQIPTNFVNKEIDATKLFSSETTKKKNYRVLYLLLPIILILFIYLNKEYFNYEIKNYFLKFIKKEFLINNQNKNSFDLIFNQIEKEVTILNDNQRIIKIFGKISNTSNIESYKIPKLQGTLIDSKNNIITTWFFNAEQDNLGPQESLNFNTSYIHNSQDIADIKIEFYKEEE